MTGTGSQKAEATKSAILQATAELIAEKGVAGFTLSEVSRRAEVNRALIYHYFRDRDTLIVHAIDDIIARNEEDQASLSPDAVEGSLRLHIAHPEIARVFFQLMLDRRPLSRLGGRLTETIEVIDEYKRRHMLDIPYDITFALILLVLAQFSWPLCREQIAEVLGIAVEEADERFIATARWATDVAVAAIQPTRAG